MKFNINDVEKQYKDLTTEDIETLLKENPIEGVKNLFMHPLFTQKHLDFAMNENPEGFLKLLIEDCEAEL